MTSNQSSVISNADLVAVWEFPLSSGKYRVEFEHGTTTGKRVIRVNGKELLRRDWMFKLVGREDFEIGKTKCSIFVDATNGFEYEYSMEVNGKPLEKFVENQGKILRTWLFRLPSNNQPCRVTLEKDTLDVWVNGQKVDTAGEFVDDGTETHFRIADHKAFIKAVTSGRRREGIVHSLIVDDELIKPDDESFRPPRD